MRQLKAEIICTGSELLNGKLNLYVPLFHERLSALGFGITREQCPGDGAADIAACMSDALKRADLVLVCGGLGPTFDDQTRQAAARALHRRLTYSKTCEKLLSAAYSLRVLPPNLADQCLLVGGAKAIENRNGSAFGEILREGRKIMILLPGPRSEWEPMFESFLASEIRKAFPGARRVDSVKFKIAGLGEPQAEALLRPVIKKYPEASFTILAGPYTVEFIASAPSGTGLLTKVRAACVRLLKEKLYGFGEDTLASAVGKAFSAAGRTISGAESCTGGLVSELLTDVPGSSLYFLGAAVTYSNFAKMAILGVRGSTIKKYGAVSPQCAAEMARGAAGRFGSDYGFAVTGIAGPDGGTPGKPVGLVHFAVAGRGKTRLFERRFRHSRRQIRACAANFILDELRKILK